MENLAAAELTSGDLIGDQVISDESLEPGEEPMEGQISAQLIAKGPTGRKIGRGCTRVPKQSCLVRVDVLGVAREEAQEVTEARGDRRASHC